MQPPSEVAPGPHEATLRRIRQDPAGWAAEVHAELLRLLCTPGTPDEAALVRVVRSATAVDSGRPVLVVVYDHAWWRCRTGLRRLLDHVDDYPLAVPLEGVEPAHDLAQALAEELREPLGDTVDRLVPDADGVHWWGEPPLPPAVAAEPG